jgi:hypothetical protein
VRSKRSVLISALPELCVVLPGQQRDWSGRTGRNGTSRPVVRDIPGLIQAVRAIVDDERRYDSLRSEIAFLAANSNHVLSRWASIMITSDVYAGVIDQHVELGGDIAWMAGLFDASYPPADATRRKRARSSPAVEIQSELSGEWLTVRIVVISQLAGELDRTTLELALRIVPVQWWEDRLGTST